jgi:hypothetical protein
MMYVPHTTGIKLRKNKHTRVRKCCLLCLLYILYLSRYLHLYVNTKKRKQIKHYQYVRVVFRNVDSVCYFLNAYTGKGKVYASL